MSASRLLYRLLLTLLGLPLLLLFFWQGWKGANRRYLRERFGFVANGSNRSNRPIWFHAASVGEVNALAPLLKRLVEGHPDQPVLLTTTTISGYQNSQRVLPEIEHHFLPFDFNHSVRRFLHHLQPRRLIVVETEIWPTLFQECVQQGISIEIINGRLSHKTLSSPGWVGHLYRDALSRVERIAARSENDRQAFISLGAEPEKCQTLGNIKYAASIQVEIADTIAEIDRCERPIVVAASTRDGEEQIIAKGWSTANIDNWLLVIVPRHPERLIDILRDLASYHVTIRSRGEAITDSTEIYLADTFGELKSFISHSELV
ncbi:MAG: 3-deoxy-D-manno-octulosonic acid transferase, partial [Gammaproteobacteria bacterium]|nr:3-deoxy-D-manno-octulosonic acid transferase [Gammaproteobacteria bacterium]